MPHLIYKFVNNTTAMYAKASMQKVAQRLILQEMSGMYTKRHSYCLELF